MEKTKNETENPFAFPIDGQYAADAFRGGHTGMTLRDYFAAKALEGAWASQANPNAGSPVFESREHYENIAKACYEMADVMLTQRQ